jgi:hypothetical protein
MESPLLSETCGPCMEKTVLLSRLPDDCDTPSSLFPGRWSVSYSFREPEWPAVCECKYDEVRDEMDREDCPLHCGLSENVAEEETLTPTRKKPMPAGGINESVA